jgi:hypothetical protein
MKVGKLLLAAGIIFGAMWFIRAPSKAEQWPDKPKTATPVITNSKCAFCGHLFRASWAPVARCPACHKKMNARLARKAHGIYRRPYESMFTPVPEAGK